MTKSELAKKTAKLMVDKLSPQELENELYQLLIMLSTDNVEYVRDDIKKGNIAGTPLPITSLVIEDYDLSRGDSMHQYEDEDDRHPVDELQGTDDRVDLSKTKLQKIEDVLESTLQKVGKERGVEVHYSQDMIGQYVYYVDTLDGDESDYVVYVAEDEDDSSKYAYSISNYDPNTNKESDILIYGSTDTFDELIDVLEKNATKFKTQLLSNNARWEGEDEDANAGQSWYDDDYEVEYRFEVTKEDEEGTLDKISTTDFANEFYVNDDIYIYDEYNDRWIQHEITEVILTDGNHTAFVIEPIGGFGPTALLHAPFTDKQVRRKSENKSLIYEDNYMDSGLIDKIESHPDVKKAWMDEMAGVIYMEFEEWNGPEFNYEITVAATPGWEEEDEIPVQVDVEERDTGDFHNYPSKNNVSMRDSQVFITEQGVYPSKEQYHQIYYDKIDDIKRVAEGTLDNERLIN